MKRRRALLAPLLGLLACDGGSVDPSATTALALEIWMEGGSALVADAGTVRIEGPTNRTFPIQPGETRVIEGLQPGGYTVSLEAFLGGELESFGETSVTVVAGQIANAGIGLQPFVSNSVTVGGPAVAGVPVDVTFSPVNRATAYRVEWDDDPGFGSPQSTEVSASPASITITQAGTAHVRVRARNRFGSLGVPATATPVQVAPPITPLVNGVPLGNRSGAQGSEIFYSFEVPAGGSDRVVQFRLVGGSGDADIRVRRGSLPTASDFLCASTIDGNLELCSIFDPEPGTWYLMVEGFEAYSGATLDAEIVPIRSLGGGPVSGLSGGALDLHYFEFAVPGAAASPPGAAAPRILTAEDLGGERRAPFGLLDRSSRAGRGPPSGRTPPAPVAGQAVVTTSGGSGEIGLFVNPRPGGFSLFGLLTQYVCASEGAGTNQSCTIGDPQAGPWSAVVLGLGAFQGVTIQGAFMPPGAEVSIKKELLSVTGGALAGQELGGFGFQLRNTTTGQVHAATTDGTGVARANVPAGEYEVTEVDNRRHTDATGSTTVTVGSQPIQVDWINRRGLAYVPHLGLTRVGAYDRRSHEAVADIDIGAPGVLAALTPDQSQLLVTNVNDGRVSFIRTSDHSFLGSVQVGTAPLAIEVSPSGNRAYVANSESGTVSAIDVQSRTVVGTVPVGGSPRGILVTPDGLRVYVSQAGGTVQEVSAQSLTVVGEVQVGSGPFLMARVPGGGPNAYVANFDSGDVTVFELDSNKPIATIPVGAAPRGITVTPDGALAFVALRDASEVAVIDLAAEQVVTTIGVGNSPAGIAVTPDGRWVYVVNQGSGDVSVIEVASRTVVETFPVHSQPWGIVLSGGG